MLKSGNPLPKLKEIIDFERFRDILEPEFENTERKNNAGRNYTVCVLPAATTQRRRNMC